MDQMKLTIPQLLHVMKSYIQVHGDWKPTWQAY
jgi:hypothetical protein